MLTDDMKRIVREQRLGFVATVNGDGTPNLSPKGTFIVVDDHTLAFSDIRSPATLRNLASRPAIEVNFVDPFVRKGYRFCGTASVVRRGEAAFDRLHPLFAAYGDLAALMKALVSISVTSARPLVTPAYDVGQTELALRRSWTRHFRELQPGGRFEET